MGWIYQLSNKRLLMQSLTTNFCSKILGDKFSLHEEHLSLLMANLQVYFLAIYPFFALTVTNKHHKYFLQDNFLSEVSDEGDLGVIVDHQLKFSSHAKSVSSSANKTLGIIKGSISS